MTFFIVFVSFTAQATVKAELTINISDCRNAKEFAYLSELRILKNGKVFKILKPQHENKQVLKGLDFGTYVLVYKSLFNKEENLKVKITESKKYSARLCLNYIDYSKETSKPIIDQLQETDFYTIVISSQGCFHSTKDTLMIKRSKDAYTINWGAKYKTLSPTEIVKIRNFEIELNYMTEAGCTTTDSYIISYNGKSKLINDGSCNWHGDYYLKKQLFGD